MRERREKRAGIGSTRSDRLDLTPSTKGQFSATITSAAIRGRFIVGNVEICHVTLTVDEVSTFSVPSDHDWSGELSDPDPHLVFAAVFMPDPPNGEQELHLNDGSIISIKIQSTQANPNTAQIKGFGSVS